MIVRVLWRWRHRPPPLAPMPKWQAKLAGATHVALYAHLFVMPVAGYQGSSWSGYPVKFSGVTLPSWAAKNTAMKELMSTTLS